MADGTQNVSADFATGVSSLEDFRGDVLDPTDAGFDVARRLYVTGFDFRPSHVARPLDARDVSLAVRFAASEGLELAVRSGGHSLAGHSGTNGGLLIDLSGMRSIRIDPASRTAWAEAGASAGDYTRVAGEHGLATGFGDSPTVGIGGITLGGGIGFLHRALGMTIDNVIAADIVTASGEIVQADADTHPDLFWAIRGGGGNFGVATRFKFRLHEVGEVLGGILTLPADPAILEGIVHELGAAPDELSGMMTVAIAPPVPAFPPDIHGKPIIMAALVHCGDRAAGERSLAPIRSLATPILDAIHPIPYGRIYDGEAGPPPPIGMAGETLFLDHFDRSAAEAVFDRLHHSPASVSLVQFRPLGGAMARVAPDATAFPHRLRRFASFVGALYERPEDRAANEHWVGGLARTLSSGDRGGYIGFLPDVDPDRVRDAYGQGTWERLRSVKRRYDPTNLFRRNHNIPPATG